MATWTERPFPPDLGRHFTADTEPEVTFATFHAEDHVVVHGDSPEAAGLIERLLAAGYQEETTGEVPLVRSFVWVGAQPAPDPGALVLGR